MRLCCALIGWTACCFFVSVPLAPAQHHPGDWIFTAESWPPAMMGRVTQAGRITTLLPFPPVWSDFESGTMDIDNRSFVIAAGKWGVVLVDTNGQVRTMVARSQRRIQAVEIDQDGNILALEGLSGGPTRVLYRIDRSFNVTTAWIGSALFAPESMVRDIDTGDLVVEEWHSNGSVVDLWRLARDGSTVNPIGRITSAFGEEATQNIRTGEFLLAVRSQRSTFALWVVAMDAGGQTRRLLAQAAMSAFAATADRASAARPRVAVGSMSGPGTPKAGLYFFDLATGNLSNVALDHGRTFRFRSVWPDRGRNVVTLKTGPRRWRIDLDFPGEAGLSYVVLLSASGVRPGIPLPDGRLVSLTPDAVTAVGLAGGLSPILQGQAGFLDANGRGSGTLDVSSLPGAGGVRVWIQAVTLDRAAPLGLRTIADPVVLVL